MPTDRQPAALQLARDWRFLLATFAATGVGYLGSNVAPVLSLLLLRPAALRLERSAGSGA